MISVHLHNSKQTLPSISKASLNMAPSSSNTPQKKHSVFLSFRGEDTRKTFTSHLHAALRRLDIQTYIDNNLERGDEISATLLRAIEVAQLSVIVFSKNYAASRWCLDELVKIVESKRWNGQIILPIFYDIDPTVVRNQTGSYADAFAKHEQKFDLNKVQKWRHALAEVANVSGWDCSINRLESEVVEDIAKDVLQKLDQPYVGDLNVRIEKYEKLAELMSIKMESAGYLGYNPEDNGKIQAARQRAAELRLERDIRLLRLPRDV